MSVLLVQGEARVIPLADGSVHCVCTSPPYFNLRSYGIGVEHGEIGQEHQADCLAWARQEPPCAQCWVCSMRAVFKEVWRVMRPEATLWLNCGDAFSSGNGHSGQSKRYRLRADLTPDQQAYVLDELAKARRISSATQEGR